MSSKMHQLQPKHSTLKQEELRKLLKHYNISLSQLPTIKAADKALPTDARLGSVIKIDRKVDSGEKVPYYRVVVA